MARALRVRGIRPKESFVENAQRVVALRLDELLSWRRALVDPELVQELHDMRIAAKRLRYALEIFAICFADSKPVLKELTAIQEDLGTIHDLDVLTGMLRARLDALDALTEKRAAEIMGSDRSATEKSRELRRLLAAQARDRRRQGLIGLIGDKVAERGRRYAAFREQWSDEALDDFAVRVQGLIAPRPPALDLVDGETTGHPQASESSESLGVSG
jgi:hypothetical protein